MPYKHHRIDIVHRGLVLWTFPVPFQLCNITVTIYLLYATYNRWRISVSPNRKEVKMKTKCEIWFDTFTLTLYHYIFLIFSQLARSLLISSMYLYTLDLPHGILGAICKGFSPFMKYLVNTCSLISFILLILFSI